MFDQCVFLARFDDERTEGIHRELLAAKFLLMRGCSVKFDNSKRWLRLGDGGTDVVMLPQPTEGARVEAIDCSNTDIIASALDVLC